MARTLAIIFGLGAALLAVNLQAYSQQNAPGQGEPGSGDPKAASRNEEAEPEAKQSAPPTAEDILRTLREQRPVNEVLKPVPPMPGETTPVGITTSGRLLPEGTAVVSRPGRLVREADWWTFAYESDHLDHPEPPIKLLPNRNLEFMVGAAEGVTTGLVFVVSGEVTVFQGENYLLTTVAMRRTTPSNLRP